MYCTHVIIFEYRHLHGASMFCKEVSSWKMHIHGNPYINCIHYMAVMTHWEHGDRSHIPNTAPLAYSWHQTREFYKPWAVSTLWYQNTLHRTL